MDHRETKKRNERGNSSAATFYRLLRSPNRNYSPSNSSLSLFILQSPIGSLSIFIIKKLQLGTF